jgi:large subunit ribosomal protein L15
MQDLDLHAPAGANKPRRILGRGQGSGRGTTAGKGNKGQQARSGGKTYLGFEGGQMPLYRRLAHRGFSNFPFKKTYKAINIGDLVKYFEDNDVVDAASLVNKGVSKSKLPVKILGVGDCAKKLTVNGVSISESAKEKVLKAGGNIIEPTVNKPSLKSKKKSVGKSEVETSKNEVKE